MLFLFAYPIVGMFLNQIGYPYVVTIIFFVTIVYLFKVLNLTESLIKNSNLLISFFLFFFLNSILSINNSESISKLILICLNFFTSLITFYYLYDKFELIQLKNISQSIILLILFTYVYSIDVLGFPRVNDFSNFLGFYRSSQMTLHNENSELFNINYQFLGYLLNFAILFIMYSRFSKIEFLVISNIILLLLIYSFSRQNVLIHFILLFVNWVLIKDTFKRLVIGISISVIILPIIFQIVLQYDNSGLFKSIYESENVLESSGREDVFNIGLNTFLSNPLFGVGLSGMSFDNIVGVYPHNMIVEIMAETGIIGLLYLFVFFCFYKFKTKLRVLNRLHKLKFFLLMFIILFFVSLISGSMIQNIKVFSLLLVPLLLFTSSSKYNTL